MIRSPKQSFQRKLSCEYLERRLVLSGPNPFEVSSLVGGDGSSGFVLNGIDSGDRWGHAVSSAGDVNGDGFDDLIIGSSLGNPNDVRDAGESYVVFGTLLPSVPSYSSPHSMAQMAL